VLAALGLALPLHAQSVKREGFRLDRYAAPPTYRDGFSLALPSTLGHLEASAQATAHYALRPLVLRTPDERPLVQHRSTLDLAAALGLFDAVEVYARLPLVLTSRGEDARLELVDFTAPSGAALSDMAVGLSGGGRLPYGITVGGRAEAILPTGSAAMLTSDDALEPRGEALASWEGHRMLIAGSFGGTLRTDRDYAQARIGPELGWGLLVRARLDGSVDAMLELVGTRLLRARDAEGASDGFEVLVGGRKRFEGPRVTTQVGAAVAAGLSDLAGEPAFRTLLHVGIARRAHARIEPVEAGPARDQDDDQVPDPRDACPNEREDHDGFEDDDGCLDVDVDADGIADAADQCPRVAGQGRNGCPTDDVDEDGIPDVRDLCPRDAEDRDQDRDEDGCPDRDSDADGLTDDRDACPDVTGLPERQGCLQHARLERERIVLLTPIIFDTENVFVAAASGPVLDDVAKLLASRPQLAAVLSIRLGKRATPDGGVVTARAEGNLLIEALVARGVARARLSAKIALEPAGTPDRVEIEVRAAAPRDVAR
jgi:OOP family OmpA-OmpF porin